MNSITDRCRASLLRWILFTVVMIVILFTTVESKSVTPSKYKLCVLSSYSEVNYCDKLSIQKNSEVECINGVDRVDCLKKVINGHADLGVFNVEDLLVAEKLGSKDTLSIISEIRTYHEQPFKYDMVVLITNQIVVKSLSDIEGLRLCHPGSEDNDGIFTQYFEWKAVPQKCFRNKTLTENRISSLNLNFQESCKPGAWTPNPKMDEILKRRYPKLCEMCQLPSRCSRHDLYWGRNGPLNCITDCRGDVAWVRLQDVKPYFSSGTASLPLPCHNVAYLCPNGTTQPLTTDNPCVWLSNPWPFVATRRETADAIRSLLKRLVNMKDFYNWPGALNVLLSNSYQPLYELNPQLTSMQYLNNIPHLMEAISIRQKNVRDCSDPINDKKIDICVSDEYALNKCKLMSYVGNVFDVNPEFGCHLSKNCSRDVINGEADVLCVSTENLLDIDTEKLSPILYQASTVSAYVRHVSAIVKANSNIHAIEELRGKKACFVNTYGLGWNSFVAILQNLSLLLLDDQYPYELSVSKFFSKVCVIDDSRSTYIPTCFPDTFSDEYIRYVTVEQNESLALRSIIEGGADVTFLDFNYIDKYLEIIKSTVTSESFRQIPEYTNLSLNEQYLMWSAHGQILINNNTSWSRREVITSSLLMMSNLFGYNDRSTPMEQNDIFKLFGPFDDKTDVLFQDAAKQFITIEQFNQFSQVKRSNYEMNLRTIVSSRIKPETFSRSYSTRISPHLIIICYFILSYPVGFFLLF